MLILSQNSIQTIRLRSANDDVDNLTFKPAVAREINHLMTGGMPRQIAFRSRAPSFREHAQRTADVRLEDFVLHRTLHFLELEEARSLFSFGNVVVKLGGWRAG